MCRLTFSVPDEALVALRLDAGAMAAELRFAAAVKFFELGRLSSGAAADLAGVPRPLFLSRLSEYGVASFSLTEEELAEDLRRA